MPTDIPRDAKLVIAVLVFTAFVMFLNETTLTVALPAIMADYDVPPTAAQWLITGFLLTMAVTLPATGWVLQRFTTRAAFLFAAGAFLFGTVLAAVAPTFVVLLVARIAQAVGTAIIMPLLMTVAMMIVPITRRGTVLGLIGVVLASGPALGPTVAGVVLSVSSWHAIFWVMVPLVAAAGLVGAWKLTNLEAPGAAPFDVLSILLSVPAFGGLVYGLSSIGAIVDGGAAARAPVIALGVGAVFLLLFLWRQLALGRHGRALLDLRPLTSRNYTLSLLVLMCLMGSLLGVTSTLPLFLQGSLLVTALATGLALLPGGILEGILSPVAGRLYDAFGPRPLIIPGMLLVAASLFWLATADEHSGLAMIVGVHIVFSIGLAALFTSLMTTSLSAAPAGLYSHASAILSTLQQLAGAAGTATMIAVYSSVGDASRAGGATEVAALADGARAAFLTAAVIAVISLVLSLFITKQPSAPQTR